MASAQDSKALTDTEMLEALGPLDKQLRSLNQIKAAIEGYFAATSRIQGLLAQEAELQKRTAELTTEFEARRKTITAQLNRAEASIEQQRQEWISTAKAQVNAVAQERDGIAAEITKLKTDLSALVAQSDAKSKELTEKLANQELETNSQIDALVAKREAEQALFDEVKGKFEAFLGEHGLARPPAAEPAASPAP